MRFFTLILFLTMYVFVFSQTEATVVKPTKTGKRKGDIYLMWGYTKCKYSKSDIHFVDKSNEFHPATGKNNEYDFTIYDAVAHERPDFDRIPDVVNITVPQYVLRIGYFFNNKHDFAIELNYDHTKYVVTDYQRVRVKGTFNGNYVDKDTILDPTNFLHFEHTDGANFWMLNFVKRWKFYEPSPKFNIGFVVKPGAGIVYPRTDVSLFGERLNNKWHIAGWIAGIESGFRVEFLKHGVFEFVAKGSYADFRNVLVLGKGKASHHFYTGQLTMTLGGYF